MSVSLPPLLGAVVAYAALVVLQVLNPNALSMRHSVEALRPQLEWIPLFFVAFAILRTKRRLRVFLALLVVVAAINAVVSLVQFNLSPDQLASWGPGYAALVEGTGDVAGRVFTTDSGDVLVRPMGLGADTGFGGAIGLLALLPTIALLTQARRRVSGRIALVLAWGPIVALATSQGRTLVLVAVFAVLVYVALTTSARRLVPTLGAVLVVGVASVVAISAVSGGASSGAFDRYRTVTPGNLSGSLEDSRGSSIERIPELATSYPLGGGLGGVGPGASAAGARPTGLDGETQFTFLISEVGVVGLLLLCGLHLFVLLVAAARLRRIADPELRTLLASVVATLAALCATWLSGPSTASTPQAPFFWMAMGIAAWWIFDRRNPAGAGALPRVPEAVALAPRAPVAAAR